MHFELPLSATYQFLPKVNTTRSSIVMDQFGIGFEQGEHCIARDVPLFLSSGEIALFTGESGSGKSSLLRAAQQQLSAQGQNVLSVDDLDWNDGSLVDLMPGEINQSLALLAMCGLGEAQLMLRSPQELSDGQRYRFRLAYALAQQPDWIVADEFTATLDRRLARVISSNLRRLAGKTGTGFLLATTHDDIVRDVQADQHIKCHLNGQIEQTSSLSTDSKKKRTSLADECWISTGTKSDWAYFARWHYRSHHVGLIRNIYLLWHEEEPIGICLFIAPPKTLAQRNQFFGQSGRWSRTSLRMLNRQLVTLSRVVLHPTYRGAGLGRLFIRRCCELCPYPWIETLTQMGQSNPVFEQAGFLRLGASKTVARSRQSHSVLYRRKQKNGKKTPLLTRETYDKSRFSNPVYYLFDNRANAGLHGPAKEE